jgi:nucleoid-associated protein YgaU
MQLAALAAGSTATAIALATHAPHLTIAPATWTGEQLATVGAWAVALVAAAWVGATSAIALLALTSRNRFAANVTRVCAPRFVRHLVEASMVATLLVAPARAAIAAPAVPLVVAPAGDQPVVRAPVKAPVKAPAKAPVTTTTTSTTTTTTSPATSPAPAPVPAPAAPAPPPAPAASATRLHVVVPGDNLWRIARAELVARGQTDPDIATIARYWRVVVERNRNALRSHNPNLIYPGETIALPEPG